MLGLIRCWLPGGWPVRLGGMQWWRSFFDDDVASARRATLLCRLIGLFGLLLVAATWRLWTPQPGFPQVPLLYAAGSLPPAVQWLVLSGMLAGLVGMLLAPAGRWGRSSLWLFALATLVLMLLNQHRLQPWAYQFVLLAVVLASTRPAMAVAVARLFLVSFYFHSAMTKCDYAFLHTLGQQFLAVLLQLMGGSIDDWSSSTRIMLAWLFPIGELLVAAGLSFAPSRRFALAGAVALHVLLLIILGPWGLDHWPGVLLWNAYFIAQDLVLFAGARRAQAGDVAEVPGSGDRLRPPSFITALMAAGMVLPFLQPWAWFDLWPSWGLYAACSERVALQVHRQQRENLPEELYPFLTEPAEADDPWLTLRLDRWSLAALGAPIYPQNRMQLGVAQSVISQSDLGNRARIVRFSLADRWSGERRHDILTGPAQCEAAAGEYWLNARPRGAPRGE